MELIVEGGTRRWQRTLDISRLRQKTVGEYLNICGDCAYCYFQKAFHHKHEKSKVIHKTHILFGLEKNISLHDFLQEYNNLVCRRQITSRTCFVIKDWTVSYNWVINAALY